MGLRTGLLILVMLLIAALATLNWGLLATPSAISLGFMQITAPLGLIMLVLTGLLMILFLAYVLYLQSVVLLDARRHTKEMQAQRDLAEKAEVSRLTELRTFLESQEQGRLQHCNEQHAALLARIEGLENAIKARAEQSDNTMAAHIGQLEDRLDRGVLGSGTDVPR